MLKYKLLFLGLALLLAFAVSAHSGKPRMYMIIDTDCAADDFRTICMLLGNHDVEILAITTSEGALVPSEGKQKVKALLNDLYHQGIPVAAGREVHAPVPQWREVSARLEWGDSVAQDKLVLSAKDLIIKTIQSESKPIILLCLGALTNVYDVLQEKPELSEKIGQLIWYNEGGQPMKDVNYNIDTVAAKAVMKSGIPIRLVSAADPESAPVDRFYLAGLSRLEASPYAQKVVNAHAIPPLRTLVNHEHLKVWDELTVLSLYAPQLFEVKVLSPTVEWYRIDTRKKILTIQEQLLSIFRGPENVEGKVFYHFPLEEGLYIRDIMPLIGRAVQRYGLSEFRAAVLTNELHGHLGIFATIGVKMGIRAREYFDVGVDDIHVTTYAGSKPPVSCLNDGLQVSTGGTVGHGLMTVIEEEHSCPEATFKFKDKQVTLRLKPEYERQVREDLRKGIEMYGAGTEANWQYVRGLALQYWLDWDRHQIFEIL